VIELHRSGEVFLLIWNDGENRFRDESLARWNEVLDEVEGSEGAKALVTTGATKFYSNGLDLDWAMAHARDRFPEYIAAVMAIYERVLRLPCPTVAAINGHAFGAGGQLAMAHDFRVMRADRGYFCMPEVDMRAPLHPGMTAILQARLSPQTAHEMITTGRRYGGLAAREAGIAEFAEEEAKVLPKALQIAGDLAAKAHPAMARLRADLYPQVFAAFSEPMGDVLDG
jgi:enoyl-CoA hydratase/carnithine racemase